MLEWATVWCDIRSLLILYCTDWRCISQIWFIRGIFSTLLSKTFFSGRRYALFSKFLPLNIWHRLYLIVNLAPIFFVKRADFPTIFSWDRGRGRSIYKLLAAERRLQLSVFWSLVAFWIDLFCCWHTDYILLALLLWFRINFHYGKLKLELNRLSYQLLALISVAELVWELLLLSSRGFYFNLKVHLDLRIAGNLSTDTNHFCHL